jgi:hypothetical protein
MAGADARSAYVARDVSDELDAWRTKAALIMCIKALECNRQSCCVVIPFVLYFLRTHDLHHTTSTSRCGQRGMALDRRLPVGLFSFLSNQS